MTNNFIELFEQLESDFINEQRRIPVNSCLNVYYGITKKKNFRLSFISSKKSFGLESTKEIKVTQGKESENVYWTCFDLVNDDAKDVFFIFCDSLVKSIENVEDDFDALYALKERYLSWKLLLENKGKMSYERYQGLFGELYFLKEFMVKKYGIERAIESWVGPEGFSKDFSIDDTWYEIKTIGTSSSTIKINSLDQLDSENVGHLVTIVAERMSEQFDSDLCNVPAIYKKIIDEIDDHQIREKFVNKVIKSGYVDDDLSINNQKYEVKRVTFYKVNEVFPKITKKIFKDNAIVKASYEIFIGSIDKFKEE